MNKLLSVIVAAMFAAVSASAFAASHVGAQMKDEKKMEKKAPKKEATAAQKKQQERMKECNMQAADKGLKGDERKKFMSSCLKPAAKKGEAKMKAEPKKGEKK
jgi:hypothetical protein